MDEPDSSSVATKSGDDESSAEEQKPSADVYDFDTHEAKKVKKIIKKNSTPHSIEFTFSYFLICLRDSN